MTLPRLEPESRRSGISTVVTVLLVAALITALLAVALWAGILEFRPPGGGQAVISPTPAASPTALPPGSPTATGLPTAEPASPAASTASPAAGATARPSPGGIHVVQPGEALSTIGELYGIPWLLIAQANDIEEPYTIQIGQELVIPVPAQASPSGNVHIVQSGESISSIAELYGVDPTELAEANEIEDWNLIFVGQQLIIPGLEPESSPEPSPAP